MLSLYLSEYSRYKANKNIAIEFYMKKYYIHAHISK